LVKCSNHRVDYFDKSKKDLSTSVSVAAGTMTVDGSMVVSVEPPSVDVGIEEEKGVVIEDISSFTEVDEFKVVLLALTSCLRAKKSLKNQKPLLALKKNCFHLWPAHKNFRKVVWKKSMIWT